MRNRRDQYFDEHGIFVPSRALDAVDRLHAALYEIAHHEREGDYAGQVNAMRAIATDALTHEETP
jgi:hypothetical protein